MQAWVERDGYTPDDIVLTSLTRAAAAVLAGRVPVPRENIATLHALAYRALGSPPIAEIGDLAAIWNREHASLPSWQIGAGTVDVDEDAGFAPPDAELGEQMRLYSLARNRLAPYGHPLWALTTAFAREWEAFKTETGSLDFTGMLEQAATFIDALPQPVLIVDEAQDLVPLQWVLARQWGARAERFLVAGDAGQQLYGFAGARPDDLLAPLDAAETVYHLAQSYRLPPAIAGHAERLLRRHSGPLTDGREYRPDTRRGEGLVRPLAATWRRPEAVVEAVQRRLADTPYEAGEGPTVMVLAACAYMLAPTVRALREAGVPFHNPMRRANGAWNPLGSVARHVEGKRSTARMVAAYAAGEPYGEWIDLLRADVFLLRSAKKLLAGDASADFDAVVRPEHRDALAAHDLGWLLGHLLAQYRGPAEYAASVVRRSGPEAITQPPRVVIGTGHSVKGGESRMVICYPDMSASGMNEAHASQEGADAAVRLAYVCWTRASEELVLCDAADPRGALW